MAKPLKYAIRRVIRMMPVTDMVLRIIASKRGTTPTNLGRIYIEKGVKADAKKYGIDHE